MPRTGLAALAFLATIGIAAYVLMPDDSPDPLDPLQEPAVETEEERDAVAVDSSPAPEIEAAPVQRETVEPSASTSAASARDFETYEGADGALVRVIDKPTGEPVAGAEVLLIVRDELDESQLEMAMLAGGRDLRGILEEFGHRYKTGADGTVRTRPFTDYPVMLATFEGSSGFHWQSDPGEREVEIFIEPELIIRVQVVDQAGEPVPNAPVSLRMDDASYSFTMFTRNTDADGELVLDDLKPYLESMGQRETNLVLALATLQPRDQMHESTQVPLNQEVQESGQVKLVMPETGQVVIEVVHMDGQPYEGAGAVSLRRDGSENSFGPRQADNVMRQLEDGRAVFHHVALGQQLTAELHSSASRNTHSLDGAGPISAGEQVVLRIERPAYPEIRVVVVDPDANPYADQRILLSIESEHQHGSNDHSLMKRSDETGALTFELEERSAEEANFKRTARFSVQHEDGRKSSGHLDLSQPLPAQVNDMGQVVLEPDPVLLEGRVVDAAGDPVIAARVSLQSRRLDREGHPRGWSSTSVFAMTGANGEFILIGDPPESPEYSVKIFAKGFEELEEPVQLAGQSVEFRLNPGTYLAGRLIVDEGVSPFTLNVRLHDGDDGITWCSLENDSEMPENEARFEVALEVGVEYRLEVQTSVGEVLYELPGIYVSAGTTTEPPSLQPLDLRGIFRTIEITALSASGQPLDATFLVRSADDQWRSFSASDGVLELEVVEEIHELTVQHPEHAPKTLEGVRNDQTVRLDAGLEVTLVLPSDLLGIEENISYNVQIYPEADVGHRHYTAGSRIDFSDMGRAKIFAPGPGKYRVSVGLFYADGNHHRSSSFTTGSIEIISGGTVHNLQVDRDRFDRTLNRLLDRD